MVKLVTGSSSAPILGKDVFFKVMCVVMHRHRAIRLGQNKTPSSLVFWLTL